MKWLNFIPFVIWMIAFLPSVALADFIYIKAKCRRLDDKGYETAGIMYIVVGIILFFTGTVLATW